MVSIAHTLAMTLSGAVKAVSVYIWLGLKFTSKTWFNLDAVWSISLVLVGVVSLTL